MGTMQQPVTHLDHSGMPTQSQMAHPHQSTSRANSLQPGEESLYKLQRQPPAPLSPATYSNYTPTHTSVQYAQQPSPYANLPPQSITEDTTTKKDDLLKQIRMVDANINKVEGTISNLKKKEEELIKQAACLPNGMDEEKEAQAQQPKYQTLAQKIYAENRRKAQKDEVMEKFGPKIELPLYNQPSDTAVYHENIKRHTEFKKRLLLSLSAKIKQKKLDDLHFTQTYSRLLQEWHQKVNIIENSAERKSQDGKNREVFEKVFPELRKQKEERERFSRVGTRIKSEPTLEEITERLQELEMKNKKMHSYAVIPPLLLNARQRQYRYINNNGRIENFAAEYQERQVMNTWTTGESEIFIEKFLQHPKNFGVIASFLDRKSASDCVQYYYHTKQKENYKRLLRKSRQRSRSSRNPYGKVHNVNANTTNNPLNSITSSVTGVTTRLQREQLQKQATPAPLLPLATHETPSNSSTVICDTLAVETSVEKEHTTVAPVQMMAITPPPCEPLTTATSILTATITAVCNDSTANIIIENKTKERKKEKKKKKKEELGDTTNEEMLDTHESEKDIQPCTLCKNKSECTRALLQSHATQYGLREQDVPAGARVCNTCRRKFMRSRYALCPLPSCPNFKRHRVKRLRALPMNWPELPHHIKDPIIAEFQIPLDVSKCCSACFYLIGRRLMPIEDGVVIGRDNLNHGSVSFHWTEKETEAFKKALRGYGNRWSEVAQVVGPTKTQHHCKNFFLIYKKKFEFDKILQEHNKVHSGQECKLLLTDEEESSSSTSSCGEMAGLAAFEDSDTASADSPIYIDCSPLEEKGKEDEHSQLSKGKEAITERESVGPLSLIDQKGKYESFSTVPVDNVEKRGELEESWTVPEGATASSSLTVKDIMLGVIEMQLMKNQVSSAPTCPPPTISSILKTDRGCIKSGLNSMATLSVIGSQPSLPSEVPKERSAVINVQPPIQDRETEGTLDLSIKKPRTEFREILQTKHAPSTSIHSVSVYKTTSTHTDSNLYTQVASPQLSSKLSPNLVDVGGSILHGTPVSYPSIYPTTTVTSRYDSSPLLRQMTPPATKEASVGSITRGTPVHQRGTYPGLVRNEYYNNSSGSKRQTPTTQSLYTRPSVYTAEQQQIIMNDYITSQQMPETSARRTYEKTSYYQPHQGVIKLHSTKPPSPNHCPPGHEAFSNLVDVAIRQPSLPVPLPQYNEDKRLLQKGLEERFTRDNAQNRFGNRDQERFTRENHKIHNRSIPNNHHQQQQIQLQQQQRHIHQQQQQMRDHQIHQQIHHRREHRENFSQLFHHHQQQQQRELEHHRLSRIQQLPADYAPPREDSAQRMLQFSRKQLQQPLPTRPHAEALGGIEGNSNSAIAVSGGGGNDNCSGRVGQGGSDSSTMTAASLIDAIITHQINQTGNDAPASQASIIQNPSGSQSRTGDRLFQGFHREGSEANGIASPVKSGGIPLGESPDSKQGSLNVGEHIESMINRNYPSTLRHSQFDDYEPQAWKLRRTFQQQESDQSQVLQKKNDKPIAKMTSRQSPSPHAWYYEQPVVPLSPLDYVKNRIAEVMRTSGEEGNSKIGGRESPSGENMTFYEGEEQALRSVKPQTSAPFIATSAAYMYPFSALSLNAEAPPVPVSFAKTTSKQPVTTTDSVPEPAPLLSAQYESLSDED